MAELVAAEPLLLRVDQAEPRYNEAVAIAVAACAADTVGQTCYICLGPGDEEEGLVRMCACRGTAGFVHVSCLAEQAKILLAVRQARANLRHHEARQPAKNLAEEVD